MKKILLSSIILFLFSVSVVLFQISCKKEAVADVGVNGAGGSNLGVILFQRSIPNTSGSFTQEIWMANYDGTNQKKIPVSIPANHSLNGLHLSPDGKTLFVEYYFSTAGQGRMYLYSYTLDGSNQKLILDSGVDKKDGFNGLSGVY